jgi:hypothetical protein
MRQVIDDEGYWAELRNYERSAWRFEAQPAYFVDYEREQFDRFLAGHPDSPDDNPDFHDWFTQIRRQVAEGKTMTGGTGRRERSSTICHASRRSRLASCRASTDATGGCLTTSAFS